MRSRRFLGVLIVLGVLLATLVPVASAATAPAPGPMDGDWYLEFTWDGYATGNSYFYIDAGKILGTFTTGDGYNGITLYIPPTKSVFMRFTSGTLYRGTMDATLTYMSGTMTDSGGYPGTWEAWKGGPPANRGQLSSPRDSSGN
ncbi:MAG: hypothetical protein NT169_16575 [Chloroflexi bacterium]|nr:hypothetical protein [Chloroflexota bacterium]